MQQIGFCAPRLVNLFFFFFFFRFQLLLQYAGDGINRVLRLLASKDRHPVALYCTAGVCLISAVMIARSRESVFVRWLWVVVGLQVLVYVWLNPSVVKGAAARVLDLATLELGGGSTAQPPSLR